MIINENTAFFIANNETALTYGIGKRLFYSFANFGFECLFDIEPKKELLANLRNNGVDLFTFINREFLKPARNEYAFHREVENYAIMRINSYDDWWSNSIKKHERYSVRKAQKSGIKVKRTEINDELLRSVQKIYNETPIREGRRYSGYGQSIQSLRKKFQNMGDSDLLGAYLGSELVGLIWIRYGNRAALIQSFVSLLEQRNKCPNNALISEAVKRCASRHFEFLVYGNHYGFLPSLDVFRTKQGFQKFPLSRYYVPLTTTGEVALKLRLHRKFEYLLPIQVERPLLQVYNRLSRTIPPAIWHKLGEE
jgi:hypothetical protein